MNNSQEHNENAENTDNYSLRRLYCTINVAVTRSCRELCCSPNTFLKEKTRSAAVEEGWTKNTFSAADDQWGSSAW